MIGSETTSIRREHAAELLELVEKNVSSIDMLSSLLGTSSEETKEMLIYLVEEGKLAGRLTSDGSRFYKSYVKTSEALKIPSAPEPKFEKKDTRPGIYIMLSGFILFIVGNILVNLNLEFSILWSLGSALLLAGPLVLIGGLFYVSIMNPPQKLR
jgi:hypothetical protein